MRGLDEERKYAERCRVALQAMIAGARENVVVGQVTWGDRYTAERLGYYLKSLARELGDEGAGPPFFGLIGYGTDESAGEHRHQTYYLGRRHISDAIGRPPLVIDWRAPVSTSFYRASPANRFGVSTRRRFGWSEDTLTGYEDEHLDQADLAGTALGGILRAEIERPRTGPMRDIVATIQPEQDVLVRAELAESLCVQGAPGTGKTAVGLHRAAYLLYVHRARLQRNGVLVLGPNRAFLHYISAVLPTLGEVDVEQTTIEELLTGKQHPVRATDELAAARVKQDPRMAEVLRAALYHRLRPPAEAVVVPDSSYRWRVNQPEFEQLVDDARQEAATYNLGRDRVISRLVAVLQRQAEARGQNCNGSWLRKMNRAVMPAVDAVWPAVRAEDLLADLLSDHAMLAAAAGDLLSGEEQAAIAWKRPRKAKSAQWTAADAVLLDEARALLERGPSYGHVIIDEAQDLSPMQCRAIARRSEHGSITVLGDLAQGTTPWAARDWPQQLTHLGKPDSTVIALTTGYRVPAVVVEFANRLFEGLGVDVPPARSFRADGRLTVQHSDNLTTACTDAVRAALKEDGSIGVIATDDAIDQLRDALRLDGIDTIEAEGDGRVAVVPASLAKGLEYDHVIVIEPAAIIDAEPRGLNRLYVVLTRAVSRLDVLHSRPLPPQLRGSEA
ncbi:HelD family protein [Kribbella sp. CA-293567]|uniref:HelD family protein n=1 Tax=Kribbella sp. CA-293567 TaxID=3002436 RepID=UPI0022DD03B0|nr:AAA family ATPase [Kribbella sp. CA-293567]WBQ08045.1 AAA family ATPase [Kribbella sp. CA-293567]